MYDLLVFIGRFQPLHLGHQEVIERALSLSKNVLVLVGSSGQARSPRNPFTYSERALMINRLYPDVLTKPIHDHTYNDTAWITEVQEAVNSAATYLFNEQKLSTFRVEKLKIGLIGCAKDHTSYYLKLFPDWASEAVKFVNPLNSTDIRKLLWDDDEPHKRHEWAAIMAPATYDWLMHFRDTAEGARMRNEYQYLKNYKKQYGEGPFLTADTLVQVGGKILLITRGKEYGHGLLALPGGFVNKNETFRDAHLRELREETNLRVPVPVIKGTTIAHRIFDDPHRSARARLVTECFHVKLENDISLPEVRGSDDADHADWYDVAWILANEDKFFEDHYFIIRNMLGV